MDQTAYVKVFDVLDTGFKDWTASAFGLIFIAISLAMFFSPTFFKRSKNPESKWNKSFRYYFLGFAIIWTAITFFVTYTKAKRHEEMARNGTCKTVAGKVENFVPMPWSGHAMESFTVSGVRFQYSDYVTTDAFNTASSHGGPINRDSDVRICYDPLHNEILRLEIRDRDH